MEKTFENFTIDCSNEFAYKVSLAVAERPREAYNPFIIIGDHGLGKTHLACAMKDKMEKEQGLRVLMKDFKDICEEWILEMKSVGKGKYPDISEWFQDYDVIILEDINYLKDKEASQTYFAEVFCKMASEGKQLVLTSSLRLAESSMCYLYDRMKMKCGMWLLAELMRPTWITKYKFLYSILRKKNWDLRVELRREIATRCITKEQIQAVVNELELACVFLLNREVNMEDLDEILVKRNL